MDEVMHAGAYDMAEGYHDEEGMMGTCNMDDPDDIWISTEDPHQQPPVQQQIQQQQQQYPPTATAHTADTSPPHESSSQADNEQQLNTSAALAKARRSFQWGKRFYPTRAKGDSGIQVDVSAFNWDIKCHDKLRCKAVSNGGMGKNKVLTEFQRSWWEPLIWAIGQLEWSEMWDDKSCLADKRAKSVSYLEMACAIDILTQGQVGPVGASYKVKTALIQYGIHQVFKLCTLTGGIKNIKVDRFIGRLQKVDSVAPLGLGNPAGLWRRPRFEKVPGLMNAMGTLLVYARDHDSRLDTPLPRHRWNGTTWAPSQIWHTMDMLAARRNSQANELDLNLQPQPLRMFTQWYQ